MNIEYDANSVVLCMFVKCLTCVRYTHTLVYSFGQFCFLDLLITVQMYPPIDSRCVICPIALAPVLPDHSHLASLMPLAAVSVLFSF